MISYWAQVCFYTPFTFVGCLIERLMSIRSMILTTVRTLIKPMVHITLGHSILWLMAPCGLWPPVAYGLLWLMAPCSLWLPVAYGLMWLMAPCGLCLLVAYGLLWLMAPCGLWPPVAYGLLWLMVPCNLIFCM